jgi:anti-anti-sigma factor
VVHWYERCSPSNLRVDLGCVEFIDGRGVSLVVDLVRRAEPRGGAVTIDPVSSCVLRLLDICGLRSLMDPTRGSAAPEPALIG